jgi:hypothetical protein
MDDALMAATDAMQCAARRLRHLLVQTSLAGTGGLAAVLAVLLATMESHYKNIATHREPCTACRGGRVVQGGDAWRRTWAHIATSAINQRKTRITAAVPGSGGLHRCSSNRRRHRLGGSRMHPFANRGMNYQDTQTSQWVQMQRSTTHEQGVTAGRRSALVRVAIADVRHTVTVNERTLCLCRMHCPRQVALAGFDSKLLSVSCALVVARTLWMHLELKCQDSTQFSEPPCATGGLPAF